jgi:hypothetical protein
MKQTTLTVLFFLALAPNAFSTEIISPGSQWHFYDKAEAPDHTWNAIHFNASSWQQGFAQFGYGDNDENTVTSFGGNPNKKTITQYFRKQFTIKNSDKIKNLKLRYIIDDGSVFYINGHEAYRVNLPINSTHNTLANHSDIEHVWVEVPLSHVKLNEGINVIAVEVHQLSIESSDISFDAALIGIK